MTTRRTFLALALLPAADAAATTDDALAAAIREMRRRMDLARGLAP